MTEKEYNEAPGVRRSDLWRIHDSPEKFKYFLDNPEPPSPAFVFGSMVHKLLLEPETFDDEYAIAPEVDKRTKAGKEEWAAFCAAANGKTVVSAEDYDTAFRMAEKVLNNPKTYALLNGKHEVPFFWTDEDTGEGCKVRCDCLTWEDGSDVPTVVDYKSATDARTRKFSSDAAQYGYFLQAAMYTEGVMKALGLKQRPGFKFIVQEKKPPYAFNIVTVPEEAMLYGIDTFRELIGTYHECKEMDNWFGYSGAFDIENELTVPGWARPNGGDELME